MSDTTIDTIESTASAHDAVTPDDEQNKNGREAAKYRRQLRDVEQELEGTRGELLAAREHILTTTLSSIPEHVTVEALTAAGHPVESFFTDGALDATTLQNAVKDVSKRFGHQRPLAEPLLENTNKASINAGTDWSSAFRPKSQRNA